MPDLDLAFRRSPARTHLATYEVTILYRVSSPLWRNDAASDTLMFVVDLEAASAAEARGNAVARFHTWAATSATRRAVEIVGLVVCRGRA